MENTGIKEALEYAVQISAPKTFDINGETFSRDRLIRIEEKKEDLPTAIEATTLTGFINYINANADKIDLFQTIISIASTQRVELISTLNKDKDRACYITARAIVPSVPYGQYTDREEFNILLQSTFVQNEHRDILLQYIGNIKDDESVTTMDDGVSQKIVAQVDVATVAGVILPNPVTLTPYRTFQEVEQVSSSFVFRVKKGGYCALFEADGGEWAIRCRAAIKEYLESKLPCGMIIIG